MISIEEMEAILDEISEEFPPVFYKELNGGIILLPEAKLHEESIGDDLYILGEYICDECLGRFIALYYGSFCRVCGHLSKEALKAELRDTLKHEFRHHVESLAGERGLELEDERELADYLSRKARRYRIIKRYRKKINR